MYCSRREALSTLGAFGTGLGLSACSILPISPFCPADPAISDPTTPLTIDVHAHVFNGSDLQVDGFISKILALDNPELKQFGPILQELGNDFAPTAKQELGELQTIGSALGDNRVLAETIETYKDAGYRKAVIELKAALRRVQSRRARTLYPVSDEVSRQILALPEDRKAYRVARRRQFALSPEAGTLSGVIDFIIRNFQYRYVNVHDYLTEYSTGKERKVDLFVAHLVDYDWPIGGGNSTTTPLDEQILVMEQVTRLTNGRVHCFAPYDPLKEVAYGLGLSPNSSLKLVQNAVMSHGFVGVKLYPPMGFAPLLNASLGQSFWNVPWLPPRLRRPDMGKRLDNALGELYTWCLINAVPIMAHTSPSNGPSAEFKQLTRAKYWRAVRDQFAGIRVDFGHFGDSDMVKNNGWRARHLADLMTPASSAGGGENLFADSAYLVDLLSRPMTLESVLSSLYRYTANKGDAALSTRFMYGTDWEMVVIEGRESSQYLERFEAIFRRLSSDPSLSDQFFGTNAANFLGLRTGQQNRTRLDLFYALGPKPAWMTKVDSLKLVA